jgi:hypothetical protein
VLVYEEKKGIRAMADRKKRPLPRPPGRARAFERAEREDEGGEKLVADELAEAMAGGRLQEYIQRELPDSEEARALAGMMMGLMGMVPPDAAGAPDRAEAGPPKSKKAEKSEKQRKTGKGGSRPPEGPPEDILKAARAGDAQGLIKLLEREHRRRHPGTGPQAEQKGAGKTGKEKQGAGAPAAGSGEREVAEALVRIASENGVSVDWVVFRALRLYVEDYLKTGRL